MKFKMPESRKSVVKVIAERLKKQIKKRKGLFERTHGNSEQSGWPSHFCYLKEVGQFWIQVKNPKGTLGWQKVARFRHWGSFKVPLYVLESEDELDLVKGPPNWYRALLISERQQQKACQRLVELKQKLPEPPKRDTYEQQIADQIQYQLEQEGWLVEKSFGNRFQVGWPDYFLYHPEHGFKWLETKRPGGKLRASQYAKFGRWTRAGARIWVLDSADQVDLLFKLPNWYHFPHESWGKL